MLLFFFVFFGMPQVICRSQNTLFKKWQVEFLHVWYLNDVVFLPTLCYLYPCYSNNNQGSSQCTQPHVNLLHWHEICQCVGGFAKTFCVVWQKGVSCCHFELMVWEAGLFKVFHGKISIGKAKSQNSSHLLPMGFHSVRDIFHATAPCAIIIVSINWLSIFLSNLLHIGGYETVMFGFSWICCNRCGASGDKTTKGFWRFQGQATKCLK